MKTKGILAIFILGILLVSAFACGGGGESEATPTPIVEYATYSDPVNGFSVSYPGDWEIVPEELIEVLRQEWGEEGEALIAFWAPVACGDSIPNFIVANEELPYAVSVQTFFETIKRYLGGSEGYTPVSEEELTIDGIAAIKHVYTLVIEGENKKRMFVCLVSEETIWAVTFYTVPTCWSQYEPIFDTIIGSFQLLD